MKIGVIGAGWAGLSAAVHLDGAGHAVTVFEAAHTLGGRARRVHAPRLGLDIDNGQHILLGAYTETLALIESLGIARADVLHEESLALRSADGGFRFAAPDWPAPWHLLAAVLAAKGISWGEKWRLLAAIGQLRRRRWIVGEHLAVLPWLEQQRQSAHLIRRFWHPLCLAALNTPLAEASAQLLATVLRDSLGGPKSASRVLIPKVDLSRLWPDRLPASLDIRRGHSVRSLTGTASQAGIDGESFDAVVVAAGALPAARLLRSLPFVPAAAPLLAGLAAMEHRPIATLSLKTARPWGLPHAMLMLDEAPQRLHFGQWLFDRSAIAPASAPTGLLSIVISDAQALARLPRDQVVAAIIEQVREQAAGFAPMPEIVADELIVEKRATFAALPAMRRPGNATPWPGIWVCGDWTDTGYPAVLEGAVRSGKRAAELIAADSKPGATP
jgi:squalene-associated FAD-dependent desaturase